MPTNQFPYVSYALPGGNFKTRPDTQEDIPQLTIHTTVGTAHSITPAESEAILASYLDEFSTLAQNGKQCSNLCNRIRISGTSGGSATEANGFHNAKQLNWGITIEYLSPYIQTIWETLSILLVSILGIKGPLIRRIYGEPGKVQDHYLAGAMIRLAGVRLLFDPADMLQGIFLTPVAGGATIRITTYGEITQSKIQGLIPVGTTGAQKVEVRTMIGDVLRVFAYITPLTTP